MKNTEYNQTYLNFIYFLDSFSSDDIALSYLQLACSDIVQTVHSQLRVYPKV